MGEFREVLHEWARRQLEERSDHTGPFRVVEVWVGHDWPSSISSELVEVGILFEHDGGSCASWRAPGDTSPCPSRMSWCMPDTVETVKMLNELFAIADQTD